MADMFGAPIGISQGTRDADASATAGFHALSALEELGNAPIKRELLQAHAKLYGAQADEHLLKVEQERKFGELLANMGRGNSAPADPKEMLRKVGDLRLQAGQTTEARQIYNTLSNIETREVTQDMLQTRAANYQDMTRARQAKRVGDLATTMLESPEAYRRGILIGSSEGLDMSAFPPTLEEGKPLVEQLRDSSVSRVKQLELDARTREADSRDRAQNSRLETEAVTRRLREQQERTSKAREDAIIRSGGAPRTSSPEQKKEAAAFIQSQLGGSATQFDKKELEDSGGQLANAALGRMMANRGLTYDQALAQAFQAQDWEYNNPLIGKSTAKLRRDGRDPARAYLQVPGQAERKAGSWYRTPKGVYQWTKDGWVGEPLQGQVSDYVRGSGGGGGGSDLSGEGAAGNEDDEED